MNHTIVLCALIAVFVYGCTEQKAVPIHPAEMSEYHDPGYGLSIKYPKDWKQMGTAGKAVFAQSQDVIDKFQNPQSGIEGGMVIVEVIRYEGKTADQLVQSGKDDLKQTWQSVDVQPDAHSTIAGKQTTSFNYTVPVTSKKKIVGTDTYIPGDTAMYKVTTLSFGEDQVTVNGEIYSAMLASFVPPVVVAKKPDFWQASSSMEAYDSPFFTMKYPDNLNVVDVKKAPKDDFAMEMRADRLDCSFHADVFGAQNLTVEKVWNQNKDRYHAKSSGQSTIGDQPAMWADYSPRKDIGSRVYFVVKNNKVVRITVNYASQQKEVYFPTFEGMVKSIKLK